MEQSKQQTKVVSCRDAAVLNFLKTNYENYRKSNEQLSVVLGELVKKLDYDGSGIDVFLLHYVSEAMETLRSLLSEIEDLDYEEEEIIAQK